MAQRERAEEAEGLTADAIKRRTARGIASYAGARGTLLLGSLIGGIFLARLLSPRDFGVYALVSFVVVQLNALGHLSMNATLIRDDDPPTVGQLRSVFTLNVLNSAVLFSLVWAASPWLTALFSLPKGANGLFHLVALLMWTQPFATVSVAIMSRRLAYGGLAALETIRMLLYQGTAVGLALAGFEYWSFGWAALTAAVGHSLLLMIVAPWRVGLAWEAAFLKRCVSFGGAFQLSRLTAIPRDNIVAFLGGPLFGPTVVGLLSWSGRLAAVCSQNFVAICAGVSYPSLSRVRSSPDVFAQAVTKLLRYAHLVTLLSLSVVSALLPEIVRIVYGEQWMPAIPFFYCFAIRMVAGTFTTLLDSALKAQGQANQTLVIALAWTGWEWALALLGAWLFGAQGIALAAALGGWFGAAWFYMAIGRFARISVWRVCGTPVLAGVITFVVLATAKQDLIQGLPSLLVAGLIGTTLYGMVAVCLEGFGLVREIRRDVSYVA